jgi:hypothetical protein
MCRFDSNLQVSRFKVYYVLNQLCYDLDVLSMLVYQRHCPDFLQSAQNPF